MDSDNPNFITCVMEAIEEGVHAPDIQEECACRMGFQTAVSGDKKDNR